MKKTSFKTILNLILNIKNVHPNNCNKLRFLWERPNCSTFAVTACVYQNRLGLARDSSIYIIALYWSISIALLTAWDIQKRSRPQQLTMCRSLHAEALQATACEGLAHGSYLAAKAGFEPATLRSKGVDSTKAPLRLTINMIWWDRMRCKAMRYDTAQYIMHCNISNIIL